MRRLLLLRTIEKNSFFTLIYKVCIDEIKADLFDFYGAKRYRGAVMNQTVDKLYRTVVKNMTRRTEEMEDDSTSS